MIMFFHTSPHHEFSNKNVTSAGFGYLFIENNEIKVSVYGSSISLGGIKSKPEDIDTLKHLLVDINILERI